MLPFICRLDDMDEVHDEKNWFKANPSLYYRPGLLKQIKKEYVNYKKNPYINLSLIHIQMCIRDRGYSAGEAIQVIKKYLGI